MSAYADALLDCALRAYEAGRLAECEALLRMLVGRCGPRDIPAVFLLGHIARVTGRLDTAHQLLSTVLRLHPDHAAAHRDFGLTALAQGNPNLAQPHLARALALDPAQEGVHAGLAAAYSALHRPADALPLAREAVDRAPDSPDARCDLAAILGRLGRYTEAIRHYDRALALRPDDPRARYFRGVVRLTLGDMPAAWDDHEFRLALPAPLTRSWRFAAPRWTGQAPLTGQTILLHAEQGFGDTIQFVRYVPRVAALGASVVLVVQPELQPLCRTIAGVTAVLGPGDTVPPFNLECPLMSLPAAFATGLDSIPADIPYLTPDPALRSARAQSLGPWRKMRVGLAWSGNPAHPSDTQRSIPLAALAALPRRDDIECHLIQRDVRPDDRAALACLPAVVDHSAALTDFGQTAALVSLMDLVISVDTAAAHLAGALGVPAWVMLPLAADWRWQCHRDDSPWYPTLRLFRQTRAGDWGGVLTQVGRNLDAWAVQRG